MATRKPKVWSRGRGYIREAAEAQLKIDDHDDEEECRQETLSLLHELTTEIEEGRQRTEHENSPQNEEQRWTDVLSAARLRRRIFLDASKPTDAHVVMELNKLYCAEAEFLEEAQRSTISDILEPRSRLVNVASKGLGSTTSKSKRKVSSTESEQTAAQTTHQDLLSAFQHTYMSTTEATDHLTTCTHTTNDTSSSIADPEAQMTSRSDELLLEEFWQVCEHPNEAELWMLSDFCQEAVGTISTWFDLRADRYVAHIANAEVLGQRVKIPRNAKNQHSAEFRQERRTSNKQPKPKDAYDTIISMRKEAESKIWRSATHVDVIHIHGGGDVERNGTPGQQGTADFEAYVLYNPRNKSTRSSGEQHCIDDFVSSITNAMMVEDE